MRLGTTGPHDTGLSRKYLIKACEASLKRLKTDYIDLYIGHEPDMFVSLEETMRAYDDLVTQGKVRYVGCSNNSAWQVMKAMAVSERIGLIRYVCQQVNYNLIARDVEHEIVPLGVDQGVGMMAWSPLHAGLLSGKFRRGAPRPSVSRLNELDVPALSISIASTASSTSCRDRARTAHACTGRVQLGDEQAGRGYGDHRRARRSATQGQSRGGELAAVSRRNARVGRGERVAGAISDVASTQIRNRANSRLPSMRG